MITVIIDVLRAFTTAAVALAGRADGVVLAGRPPTSTLDGVVALTAP